MALSEFENKRIEKAVATFMEKRRPPAHVRHQVDLSFRIAGQSVELFEIRAVWNDPSKKQEVPVAKATYVKSTGIWKIYWQRADLKWHGYEPNLQVDSIEEFLMVVDRDDHGCFWG